LSRILALIAPPRVWWLTLPKNHEFSQVQHKAAISPAGRTGGAFGEKSGASLAKIAGIFTNASK
jgi:hypothetical protein